MKFTRSYWFGMAVVAALVIIVVATAGCGGYRTLVRDVVERCEPVEVNLKYKQKQLSLACKEDI